MSDLVTTRAVFKKFPDGDVIALFPDIPADNKGNISSYMHIGQHGAASPELVTDLDEATPEEYQDLKEELESIGYEIIVIQERLEYLRQEIEAERISYGEIAELESLKDYIEPGDVLLLQWAGVPEHIEE